MNETQQAVREISDEILVDVMSDNRRLYAEAVENGWDVDAQRLQWHYELQSAEARQRGLQGHQIVWPANYDRNDIEHVQGQHMPGKLIGPKRDCGHCSWYFAPPPVVTRRMTRSRSVIR